VVVVTWNAAADLPGFLASVRAQALDGVHLVCVDNASTDGSAEVLEGLWPGATVVRQDSNTGFAAAVNVGLATCVSEFVALLNYDVRLGDGYLTRCLDALRSDPRLGSVQGLLMLPDGRVDSAGHLLGRARWPRNRGEGAAVREGLVPAHTFGCTAAAAVYRRSALEDAAAVTGSVLEPAFFAYLEDVDLDWRLRRLGWEAAAIEGAVATHEHSGSGGRFLASIQRHIIKNRLLLLYRNESVGSLIQDLPWVAGQMIGRWLKALLTCPSSLLGITDFLALRRAQRRARQAIAATSVLSTSEMRRWLVDA
jgi:GT2 family glycosyltransferase